MNKQKIFVLVSILFISYSINIFSGDINLEQARKKEAEKDISCALQMYKEWLFHNPGDEQFLQIITHVENLEKNSKEFLTFLYSLEPLCENLNSLLYIYNTIAFMEEMHGNLTQARKYYMLCYEKETDINRFNSLLMFAQIAYYQGDNEIALNKTKEILHQAKEKYIQIKATLLFASLSIAAGEMDKAQKQYIQLIKTSKSHELYPVILLHYLEFLNKKEKKGEMKRVMGVFEKYFPLTPEYFLAKKVVDSDKNGNVSYFPHPSFLMNNNTDTDLSINLVKSEPGQNTAEEKKEYPYIQTGSFLHKENALDMIVELSKHGFKGIIREKRINEKIYYKVLITMESSDPGIINTTILKLKEVGFEGFVLM